MLGTGAGADALEPNVGALLEVAMVVDGSGSRAPNNSSDLDVVMEGADRAGGISNAAGSGGINDEERRAPWSSEDAGDGGGSTKTGARSGGCGCGRAILVLNAGACFEGEVGMTSVSNGGVIFLGETGPSPTPRPDDRLETLTFFKPPEALGFRGDLRTDLRGEGAAAGTSCGTGSTKDEVGAGVGGNSASICSTCHVRFSSRNLMRSA